MENDYLVSVLIASYNPDKERLFLTIKSILLQKEVKFQIVICDDGSEENYFASVEQFFKMKNFMDYSLVSDKENHGTVINIMNGLNVCKGKFVKTISPGDYLYGDLILKDWVNDILKKGALVSYSDAVYYQFEDENNDRKNNKLCLIQAKAIPQNIKKFKKGGEKNRKNYVLVGDVCLGASMLVDREIYIKYLKKIVGKVKYCEDMIFKLMEYDAIKSSWFEGNPVLYEFGTGISTCKTDFWLKRLNADFEAFYKIFIEQMACCKNNKLNKKIWYIINSFFYPSMMNKLKIYILIEGAFVFKLKWFFFPRKTPIILKKEFIKQLLITDNI